MVVGGAGDERLSQAMGETFEYAIKKDVRNNPIVREVDRERHRELWRSVAIGVFLVGVLLFSAWQHFELLRHGYRLEQMQEERAAEDEVNRHLRLEIETLRAPARIERLATGRLRMVQPGPEDASVIERVVPTPPPPRSVVAQR
jgi:cell division protein FtsL